MQEGYTFRVAAGSEDNPDGETPISNVQGRNVQNLIGKQVMIPRAISWEQNGAQGNDGN